VQSSGKCVRRGTDTRRGFVVEKKWWLENSRGVGSKKGAGCAVLERAVKKSLTGNLGFEFNEVRN